MYAAYGRLQAIGADPYEITPAEVFRGQFDPVLKWTERPGRTPRACTARSPPGRSCWPTSWAGRTCTTSCSGCRCSRWCRSSSPAPASCMLAHGDPRRQARAALLTIANPMLIWAVVAGAHNEALSVMFAVAGLHVHAQEPVPRRDRHRARRLRQAEHRASGGSPCSGPTGGSPRRPRCSAWARRSRWVWRTWCGSRPRSSRCCATAAYVSVGSWANPVYRFLDLFMTGTHAKIVVGVISYVGLVVIAWMLSRRWCPGPPLRGCRRGPTCGGTR